MEREEILLKIQEIFRDVLDNEDIVLSNDSKAEDIDEWDSLSHIQLIVAIEKAFGVKFTAKEMMSWKTVGDVVNRLYK